MSGNLTGRVLQRVNEIHSSLEEILKSRKRDEEIKSRIVSWMSNQKPITDPDQIREAVDLLAWIHGKLDKTT